MTISSLFKIAVIVFSFLFTREIFPQYQEIYNEHDVLSTYQYGSNSSFIGGLLKPARTDSSGGQPSLTSAYFPVLIIFVQFADETEQCDYWPIDGQPTYMNRLLRYDKNTNSNWWEAYNPNTEPISSYWCEVSRGTFHIVGLAVNVILDYDTNYYNHNGGEDIVNRDVYEKLKQDTTINWPYFDQWRKDANGLYYNESDNYIDMIYMVHRRCWRNGPTQYNAGYTPLGTANLLIDYPVYTERNRTIYARGNYDPAGSGCKIAGKYSVVDSSTVIGIMAHEHGHYLFGSGHITYSKMSFDFGGDFFFSPWERIKLGYIRPQIVNFNSTQNYTLKDFSGRSDQNVALKVPISTNDTSEFFLLASRMKLSSWDVIMEGDTAHGNALRNINPEYGKGLYIYHITNDFNYPSWEDISVMDEECADGLFYWSRNSTFIPDWIDPNNPTQVLPFYTKDSVSYENDQSYGASMISRDERSVRDQNWSGDRRKWGSEGKRNVYNGGDGIDRLLTNETEAWTSRACYGDRWDGWNVGYNEIFSPYSSPSTKSYYSQNTGIFIYYESFNSTANEASLKIYKIGYPLSEAEILNVTPPSRPMGLKIDVTECENERRYPVITWVHNSEPDMLQPGYPQPLYKRYKIFRAWDGIDYIPINYIEIADTLIHKDDTPSYTDYTTYGHCADGTGEVNYRLRYKVKAVDNLDSVSVFSDFGSISTYYLNRGNNESGNPKQDKNLPKTFALYQNYPNPFNPVTKIAFDLPKDSKVTLVIYDILGREIVKLINGEIKTAGRYMVDFNGSNLASSVYFYRLQVGDYVNIKRMMLIK